MRRIRRASAGYRRARRSLDVGERAGHWIPASTWATLLHSRQVFHSQACSESSTLMDVPHRVLTRVSSVKPPRGRLWRVAWRSPSPGCQWNGWGTLDHRLHASLERYRQNRPGAPTAGALVRRTERTVISPCSVERFSLCRFMKHWSITATGDARAGEAFLRFLHGQKWRREPESSSARG
ncbi:hypothetical protein SACE_1421 [Saccharopolyspora erythraea NRRL 2338]|uniref:Uncharacterized protein n=1 Tax=Saccharopolyspora erythraea (strain ATCC 11635 / DSM 40517 / JCM 4748 / NBRC 13426 / NCIMB 8594 / NRRL 2338) TaxID=405948 RepID=A4F9L8_SACEN|nr:hypothetical protein SACE_1421 [Saccharopolyspora erythraea NRRL 2338]